MRQCRAIFEMAAKSKARFEEKRFLHEVLKIVFEENFEDFEGNKQASSKQTMRESAK